MQIADEEQRQRELLHEVEALDKDMRKELLPPSECNLQKRTFLIGPTGAGKSSLGNRLLQIKDGDEGFQVGGGLNLTTISMQWRKRNVRTSGAELLELEVFDSPGLIDPSRNARILDEIVEAIRKARPHGIIIVTKSGRESLEVQLGLLALARCFNMSYIDHSRVALFVNQLPNDFQLRTEKPPIEDPKEQAETRASVASQSFQSVSKLLHLQPDRLTTIWNTHGTWDGVDALHRFIVDLSGQPMDLEGFGTWTEVWDQAQNEPRQDLGILELPRLLNLIMRNPSKIGSVDEL